MDNKSKFMSVPQTDPLLWTLFPISVAPRKEEDIAGGLGAESSAANGFSRFSLKKLVSAHFLIEKGHTYAYSECTHYYSIRQYKHILVVYV